MADTDESFVQLEDDGKDAKKHMDFVTVRITVQRPGFSLGFACGLFILSAIIFTSLQSSVGVVVMSTEVPFYDRSSTAKIRDDAVYQGEKQANAFGNLAYGGEGEQEERSSTRQWLYILSKTKDNSNILTESRLARVRDIENHIVEHDEWADWCTLASANSVYDDTFDIDVEPSCDGNNPGTYNCPLLFQADLPRHCLRPFTMPNFMDQIYFDYQFDTGIGKFLEASDSMVVTPDLTQDNIDNIAAFWSVYSSESFDYVFGAGENQVNTTADIGNVFFRVSSADFGAGTTTALGARAEFELGLPLTALGYMTDSDDFDGQVREAGEWLYNTYDSYLKGASGKAGVNIYWMDEELVMEDMEKAALIAESITLIVGSVFFVWAYLCLMTNSIFIASFGMGEIFMAFFPALLLYRYIFQQDYFGTLNLLAFFIIVGIGVDDIFVFLDAWSQLSTNETKMGRMGATLHRAGKAMLVTSLTTMISFFANATSAFPAIYTFGMFSAMLVFVNYCAVITYFPTVVSFHDTYLKGKYMWSDVLHRWADAAKLAICGALGIAVVQNNKEKEKDLELADKSGGDSAAARSSLGSLDPAAGHGHHLGAIETFFLRTWAPGIVKYRYFVLAFFTGIMILFIVGASMIEPDPDTPQMLPDDNNYSKYFDILVDHYGRADNPKQIKVDVVYGIDPDDPIDRSGTNPTDAEDRGRTNFIRTSFDEPAVQQHLADMCRDMLSGDLRDDCDTRKVTGCTPGTQEMALTDEDIETYSYTAYQTLKCVVLGFEKWLEDPSRGPGAQTFPSDDFGADIVAFLTDEDRDPNTGLTNYEMWVDYIFTKNCDPNDKGNDEKWDNLCEEDHRNGNLDDSEGGDFRFMKFQIKLDAEAAQKYQTGLDLYYAWDDWFHAWDKTAPEGLKDHGFQSTSQAWQYYFLNETLIGEVFQGIMLALVLAFVILAIATNNYIMAFYATSTIMCIVTGVIAFTVANGWKLGVLEAINYVMVIGLSVDYCVHLSEAYNESHSTARADRVTDMLTEMGVSVLSGAVSSLGSSFFMFFAPILFFPKFAGFIFCTISLSLVFSLSMFPALLACVGPEGEMGNTLLLYRSIETKFKQLIGKA